AETQYLSLATQVNQAEIAAQQAGNSIKIVSRAAIPLKPSDLGFTVFVAAGALAGLLVGAIWVLALDWLSDLNQPERAALPAGSGGEDEVQRVEHPAGAPGG